MKKLLIVIALAGILVVPGVLAEDDTQLYARSFRIARIDAHEMGYRVLYHQDSGRLSVTYFPHEWFSRADGAGRLYMEVNRSVPFMEVFWKDGEFSHVKVYAHRDMGHPTWQRWRPDEDPTEYFDVDVPVIELR